MERLKKYVKRNRKEIIRSLIVVVSALIVGFLAVIISQLLEKPIESYYPHDEVRGGNQIQWEKLLYPAVEEFSNKMF